MSSHLTDEEVWLRAYCAAIASGNAYPSKSAEVSLKDFREKFPKFEFVSNEKKDKT